MWSDFFFKILSLERGYYPVLPVRTRDVDSSVGNIEIFIVYVVVEQDHFLILLA